MPTSKKKLYEKYLSRVKPLLSSHLHAEMADAIYKGKTKVLRMSRYESGAFDTTWVDVIEDVLYDLGEIIKVPRTITKEFGSLTPIELAKKTNAESVQHLASHTQYVKSIDEEGNVVPSKIMSFNNDDFLFTYENRFIATFIRRLVLFIEKRYEFIQNYIPLHKEEVLMVKTKTVIDGAEVEIETRIKSKAECDDPDALAAERVAARIRRMREYILYYFASPFMKKMKNERDVRKPILMTNIIRKNLRYHHCYEVFSFIERYDSLGLNYKSDDIYSNFDETQLQEMALLNMGQFLALQDAVEYETIKTRPHSYKPRILTSIDDEEFVFGPLPRGPIEFVRVDEEYRKYLESTVAKNLPEHPKKAERLYYQDEYAHRRAVQAETREIEKILTRKELALHRFEKDIEAIIALREYEDNLLLKWEFQERLDTEEMLLNQKRSEIAAEALGYRPEEASFEDLLAKAKEDVGYEEGAHRDYYLDPDEEELRYLSDDADLRRAILEEAERIVKERMIEQLEKKEEETEIEEDKFTWEDEDETEEPIVSTASDERTLAEAMGHTPDKDYDYEDEDQEEEHHEEESLEEAKEEPEIEKEDTSAEDFHEETEQPLPMEEEEIPEEAQETESIEEPESSEEALEEPEEAKEEEPAEEPEQSEEPVSEDAVEEPSHIDASAWVSDEFKEEIEEAEPVQEDAVEEPVQEDRPVETPEDFQEEPEGKKPFVVPTSSRVQEDETPEDGHEEQSVMDEMLVAAPASSPKKENVPASKPQEKPTEAPAMETKRPTAPEPKPFIVVKGTGGNKDYSPTYEKPEEELVMDEMLRNAPALKPIKKAPKVEKNEEDQKKLDELFLEATKPSKKSDLPFVPSNKPKVEEPETPDASAEEVLEELLDDVPPVVYDEVASSESEGPFVVKSAQGYYVSENVYDKNKAHASAFPSFEQALEVVDRYGGKVVRK